MADAPHRVDPERVAAVREEGLPAADGEATARLLTLQGRMGYYRLRDGEARNALQASLEQLRQLTTLHPEVSADDADDA